MFCYISASENLVLSHFSSKKNVNVTSTKTSSAESADFDVKFSQFQIG